MTRNYLTVTVLNYSNVGNANRDNAGRPKTLSEGGATRARWSSQSIKRAARLGYEAESVLDSNKFQYTDGHGTVRSIVSTRSRTAHKIVAKKAIDTYQQQTGEELDADGIAAFEAAAKIIFIGLSTNDARGQYEKKKKAIADAKTDEKRADAEKAFEGLNDLNFLTGTELNALVETLVEKAKPLTLTEYTLYDAFNGDPYSEFLNVGAVAAVSVAAHGRFNAAQTQYDVEAGLAFSHAVTTHRAVIQDDYFTAVDDLEPQGSAHLGVKFHTDGVFKSDFTIDRRQLLKNLAVLPGTGSSEKLRQEIQVALRHILFAVPQGNKTTTSVATNIPFIIAEEQRHRTAYQFDTPVEKGEGGGFIPGSIAALLDQASRARTFDPEHFGQTWVSGLYADAATDGLSGHADVHQVTASDLVGNITDWIFAGAADTDE